MMKIKNPLSNEKRIFSLAQLDSNQHTQNQNL